MLFFPWELQKMYPVDKGIQKILSAVHQKLCLVTGMSFKVDVLKLNISLFVCFLCHTVPSVFKDGLFMSFTTVLPFSVSFVILTRSHQGLFQFPQEAVLVFKHAHSCSLSTVSSQLAKTCVLLSFLSVCLCVFRLGSVIQAISCRKSCTKVCVYICVSGGRSRFAPGSLVSLFFIFCFPFFSRHYCFHTDVCWQPGVNSRNAIKKKDKVRNLFATEIWKTRIKFVIALRGEKTSYENKLRTDVFVILD